MKDRQDQQDSGSGAEPAPLAKAKRWRVQFDRDGEIVTRWYATRAEAMEALDGLRFAGFQSMAQEDRS